MNKISAALGTILVLVAAFLFLIVFSGGSIGNFTITGADPTANFVAFLYVIVALPVGAGLAFYGYAVRRPIFAAGSGQQTVYVVRSSLATVALVLAIVALLLGLGAIYYAGTVTPPSPGTNLQGQINSINTQISAINTKLGQVSSGVNATALSHLATVNATPTVVPFRVDWCNTDNTGEDRYCPQNLVVVQGDTVQILFMHNDTDAHTFTMISGYNFQINLTYGAPGETNVSGTLYANGMHNFLTNGNFSGSCSNTGTFAQQSVAVSDSYCVSGTNLLAPALYGIAINPDPALPFSGGSGPMLINVTNTAFFPNINIPLSYNGTQGVEAWGIGAFQATTPGIYEYFCHYHVSNGMFGYLIVLPNSYCSASATNAKACGVTTTG
ncbi:MAG: hypothetical protein ACRECH_13145 [Nitrososphaerales archaeon]